MTVPDAGDHGPTEAGPWSVWGVRLVALLAVATAISLGFAWIQQYYRGVQVNTELSYLATDNPYTPAGTTDTPIIGTHFFGDFELPRNWALNVLHSRSPYVGAGVPANQPPCTILLFVPFALMAVKTAAVLYLLLSAAAFLLPLWFLLSPLGPSYRLIMLTPMAVVTTPFLGMLDRGNHIGIALALIAATVWAWRSERWFWCGAFLAAALAIKTYPAALLVVPLAFRRYRFAALVAGSAIAANLLALLAVPGGYFENFRAMARALGSQSLTNGTQLVSWSAYSIFPKTVDLLLGPSHIAPFMNPSRLLLWLPSAVYLGLVFFVIRQRRVPQWCWGPLALASVQLVVPLSGVYTTGWACLAAIWFAWGSLVPTEPGESEEEAGSLRHRALRVLLMLAIAASLVPSVLPIPGADGNNVLATRFSSPLLLLVALCVASAMSIRPRGAEIPDNADEESVALVS